MNRRFSLSSSLALLLALMIVLSSPLLAQIPDPGNPDVLEFGGVDLKVGESRGIPMCLYNDEAIEAMMVGLQMRVVSSGPVLDPTDLVRFDSATYMQVPGIDPLTLDGRYSELHAYRKGDGVDSLFLTMHCTNPPHVPIQPFLNNQIVVFWFTGIDTGAVTLEMLPDPNRVRFYPDGYDVLSGVYFIPQVRYAAQYTILPRTIDPQCGDRGTPDAMTITDVSSTYPLGESTPFTISFTNDETVRNISLKVRFIEKDSGLVQVDSIRFAGRMLDPNLLSFRMLVTDWADGTLPDSVGFFTYDISGVPMLSGDGPIAQVFISGTSQGQVWMNLRYSLSFNCADGSTDFGPYAYDGGWTAITVGDPAPPDPVFQALSNPDPIAVGDGVMFTVQADSPLQNPVDVTLTSMTLFDDATVQPLASPTFNSGTFSWTPASGDVGIWKATFEAEDLVSNETATTYAVVQVVSSSNYLITFDVEETADVALANALSYGDFSQDGTPEVVLSANPWLTGASLSLFDYTAFGLQDAFDLNEDYPNRGLAVGYIDGDAYLDAITCLRDEVWVMLGSTNNTFTPTNTFVAGPSGTFTDATLADYNGDAYLDYICLSSPNLVTIYAGGANATFSRAGSFTIGDSGLSLAAADFDGDGYDDLAVSTSEGLEIYLNDTMGGFDAAYSYPEDMGSYQVDISDQGADFDNDGDYDLCIAIPDDNGQSDIQIYLGEGDGSFSVSSVAVVSGVVSGNRAGDFNGDGLLDITFINSTEHYVAILFGDGNGAFGDQIRYAVPKYLAREVECLDIDVDGDLDIVVASHETNLGDLNSSLFLYRSELNPGSMLGASLRVVALDNVDVKVEGPEGRHLQKYSNTLPTASLFRRDLNKNDKMDVDVRTSLVTSGAYDLSVTARPNAAPEETFSLNYTRNYETLTLARNLPVPSYTYNFVVYPDGASKVSPVSGRCIRDKHLMLQWEPDVVPTMQHQSSLPFSDARIDVRIAADPDFSDVLETATVTGGRYVLQSALAVQDTTSYYWQIRLAGQSDWGGINVFHALPIVENHKDPADNNANLDQGSDTEDGTVVADGQSEGEGTADEDTTTTTETKSYALQQNQPNPFNPVTEISYSLACEGQVRLEVFNILGCRVATLVDEYQGAGDHVAAWDASALASGVYLYRISMEGFSATRKMILLK